MRPALPSFRRLRSLEIFQKGYKFAVSSYVRQTSPSLDYLQKPTSEFVVATKWRRGGHCKRCQKYAACTETLYSLLQYCAAAETYCIRQHGSAVFVGMVMVVCML